MANTTQNTVTELWQTTQNWLLLLGHKANTKFCREEISTHPDYPAITAVTDFLDSGNMQYNVVQADASYIHEFNYPLLAHIRQPGQEYMHIIPSATEWDKQKEITQHWSGITIFPEKNSSWQNEQNSACQKQEFKNKAFAILLIIIGLSLFTTSSIQQANFFVIGFGLFSLIGLIISIILLATELGYQSQIVKQVCGTVSKAGCEQVLKSKYAKAILGITPADAAVLYFTTQFLLYLSGVLYAQLRLGLPFIAIFAITVAMWSIYTQAVKLKQWCAICLGIVAVLIAQAALAVSFSFTSLPYLGIAVFSALFFMLLWALLPVKQLIKTNKQNQVKLTELKKWKADGGLFIKLLNDEQTTDIVFWDTDLVIGNSNAPVLITVACNPYCGPCGKAHAQIEELLHRFTGMIKLQIRFLCNENDVLDKRTIAVTAILQKAVTVTNSDLQQLLSDWFLWSNFEKWAAKWQPDTGINVKETLHLHSMWVQQNLIQFTPTVFVNGKKLPGRYSIGDLELLLPELLNMLVTVRN